MAKRKDSSPAKKGNPGMGSGFSFTARSPEAKAKRREASAATLREQGGGLLQLRLGRAAQGQGLGAAFGLAFNAFLIYAASSSGQIRLIPSTFLGALLWLMPLLLGAVIGVDALQRKWAPYKGYRNSRHFILSILALVLSVLGMVLIFFEFAGFGSITPPWVMYPLSVSTIAIGLISMADTWRGWGTRKLMSVLSALCLPILMVLWVGLNIDPADSSGGGLLAMFFYFIMALAALISGSELHIIASSTSTAEREILTASDVKLTQLQGSLRELQKALEFRQKGLDEKEAIIESDRRELDGELAKAETHSSELAGTQGELDKKERELLAFDFYFIMALAALISGSELHIIASSTSTAEREILTASDVKLTQLQGSLRELQKALEFRQKGLDEKEAIIESDRRELDGELAKAETHSSELAGTQGELDKKERELLAFEKKVSGVKAEIDARVEQLKLKESDLANIEAGIERGRREVTDREAAISERDKELKRIAIEVTAAQRQLDSKAKEASDLENKLKREDSALEARQKALLQKEKAIQLKDSELRLKSEQLDVSKATKAPERAKEMKDWEQKLLAKEKELGQAEVELKTLEDQLKERYENATHIEKRAADDRKHLEAKEKEMMAREKMISDKESVLEKAATEAERLKAAVREGSARLKEKESEYAELLKSTKVQQASATSTEGALNSRQTALDARQRKLDEMQASLRKEIERLTNENRELLQMKKEVERKDSELTVKALELETKTRESRAAASTPGIKDMDQDAALSRWQDDLRRKEEELQRRQYQLTKEMEAKEQSLRAQVQAGVTDGVEEVTIEEKKERVKSGTPRLDDLLYGGIPFNANLLFVGPPYVGKEVVILNFVAEGLKKGVPAILVTTSKPPVEISKEMAPILPTFVEYEQLGLVYWIDCSGSTSSSGKPTRDKNMYKVDGPTDFNGILKVVNELDHEFKGKYPYFRLAFLTLSSCVGQDQGAAMGFVQKLVNRLRQTKAVAAYALERGMHSDQVVESLEHLLDGAIQFKSDKQKTMLQVVGLGESQTRDWVPYKHSNKAIMIGSFQLERIR
ncbi:MAG: hypothetical protein E6K16_02365 [Methanobacteriota archaeon]|nr:MAG: hypothetical protein E6K16_02365 [Euryarchaeota archaeon]